MVQGLSVDGVVRVSGNGRCRVEGYGPTMVALALLDSILPPGCADGAIGAESRSWGLWRRSQPGLPGASPRLL